MTSLPDWYNHLVQYIRDFHRFRQHRASQRKISNIFGEAHTKLAQAEEQYAQNKKFRDAIHTMKVNSPEEFEQDKFNLGSGWKEWI